MIAIRSLQRVEMDACVLLCVRILFLALRCDFLQRMRKHKWMILRLATAASGVSSLRCFRIVRILATFCGCYRYGRRISIVSSVVLLVLLLRLIIIIITIAAARDGVIAVNSNTGVVDGRALLIVGL